MPTSSDIQTARRETILALLGKHRISRQSELVDLLAARGHEATQSSVSRDLREMGLKPGPIFRQILEKVLFAKLDGKLPTPADEMSFARRLVDEPADEPATTLVIAPHGWEDFDGFLDALAAARMDAGLAAVPTFGSARFNDCNAQGAAYPDPAAVITVLDALENSCSGGKLAVPVGDFPLPVVQQGPVQSAGSEIGHVKIPR
mgnify:CR=1 FL=1